MRRLQLASWIACVALSLGCAQKSPESGGVDPKPAGKVSTPKAMAAPDPAGAQKAWRANFGKVVVIAVAGEGFGRRVRSSLSLFPVVIQIANAEPNELALDREHDDFALKTTLGREAHRTDIWQRADLMTLLAALPPEDRNRFRYPSSVLPGAYVEYIVTFEGDFTVASTQGIWVRIASLPSSGVWLAPISAGERANAP